MAETEPYSKIGQTHFKPDTKINIKFEIKPVYNYLCLGNSFNFVKIGWKFSHEK